MKRQRQPEELGATRQMVAVRYLGASLMELGEQPYMQLGQFLFRSEELGKVESDYLRRLNLRRSPLNQGHGYHLPLDESYRDGAQMRFRIGEAEEHPVIEGWKVPKAALEKWQDVEGAIILPGNRDFVGVAASADGEQLWPLEVRGLSQGVASACMLAYSAEPFSLPVFEMGEHAKT